MKLVSNRYGKKRVRVLKILREGPRHVVKELTVGCLLRGAFDASYTAADNRSIVPTDTIKNTVTVVAHQQLGREAERFGVVLGKHFLARHSQVDQVELDLRERVWNRQTTDGEPHTHAFRAGAGTPFARVTIARGAPDEIESGIDDLLIMKSTGSGFSDFATCELTTLAPTSDRILATTLRAGWSWTRPPADYNEANELILEAMLRVFAVDFSVSVQATACSMAAAAFAACPDIRRVSLALPNKHFLLANLKPFKLENPNVTFVPTDEPHGQIEAVFDRD